MNCPDLNENSAKRFAGDGYVVKMYFPHGVRYMEGDHVLTLSSEPLLEKNELGRERWLTAVYLPTLLKWDSGIPIDSVDADIVLSRIKKALKSGLKRYKLISRDDIYS
jgi:hypothetical protein